MIFSSESPFDVAAFEALVTTGLDETQRGDRTGTSMFLARERHDRNNPVTREASRIVIEGSQKTAMPALKEATQIWLAFRKAPDPAPLAALLARTEKADLSALELAKNALRAALLFALGKHADAFALASSETDDSTVGSVFRGEVTYLEWRWIANTGATLAVDDPILTAAPWNSLKGYTAHGNMIPFLLRALTSADTTIRADALDRLSRLCLQQSSSSEIALPIAEALRAMKAKKLGDVAAITKFLRKPQITKLR